MVGDFDINVLDFNGSKMAQNFANLMFRDALIPTINKPTFATRNTATAIDHIITNSAINAEFKTGIIKTDISDHFPIFFIFKCVLTSDGLKVTYQIGNSLKHMVTNKQI